MDSIWIVVDRLSSELNTGRADSDVTQADA